MAAVCSNEVITNIVPHLYDPIDLTACSAVSRGWRSAYLHAQITSLCLEVPNIEGRREAKHVCGLMQWVRAQHARGNFCRVTTLTMQLKEEAVSDTFCFFSGAVLMLAATWPLQRVRVSGPFDLDLALRLLPACITYLDLHPSTWALPKVVDLASFCKFTGLQTLTIYPFGDDPEYEPGNCFLLTAMLTSLSNLTLSSWPLKIDDGCSVAGCLPSLLHASLHVHVDLVNDFTFLDHCRVLFLILLDPIPTPPDSFVIITVGKSSQLRMLDLCGPLVTGIRLSVRKPGLQLRRSQMKVSHIF